MAKSHITEQPSGTLVWADGEALDLRNRYLAAFLAWIIPGAGHYYQNRKMKAAIFAVCTITCFLIGMVISGGKCVYYARNDFDFRWQYGLQAGIGLPALPAVLQARRSGKNAEPLWGGFMAPPQNADELDLWHADTASGFDMGTLYTMIAGLLNLLAVFDAYGGPMAPPKPKGKAKDDSAPNENGDRLSDSSNSSSAGSGTDEKKEVQS